MDIEFTVTSENLDILFLSYIEFSETSEDFDFGDSLCALCLFVKCYRITCYV